MNRHITAKYHTKTVSDFIDWHKQRMLNLSPGFQRKSVWSEKDRKKLIRSVFEGFPVPSIFLYRREDEAGRAVYDVLDGKQRLESLFAYCRVRGFGRQGFSVPFQFMAVHDPDKEARSWSLKDLKSHSRLHHLLDYKLQVVEVRGDLADIQELFVRINSTGKKLSNQERRKAQFIASPVLAEAELLASKLGKQLLKDRIVTRSQQQRMKDVELICELLLTLYQDAPINKKAAVDTAMAGNGINRNSIAKASRDLVRIYAVIRKILPEVRATRFKNHSEFYSLMSALNQLQLEGKDLSDRRGQGIAARLLCNLSDEANAAQVERRSLKTLKIKPVVRDYLMAVEQGADAVGQRRKRQAILVSLIGNTFSERDRVRGFNRQQRELVWSATRTLRCPGRRNGTPCRAVLTWKNFQVDHIQPWSKGGRTNLANARALCRSCNAAKGNRTRGRSR